MRKPLSASLRAKTATSGPKTTIPLMGRKYNREIEDVCGALKYEGLSVPEIVRRLNEDQAGLGYPVPIKERRAYEYVKTYEERNGPPPDPADEDQSLDSIVKLKRRARAIVAREIAHYENKRPGKITPSDSVNLGQFYATLDGMERKEESAVKRSLGRSKNSPSQPSGPEGKAPESALERLAREEGEVDRSGDTSSQETPLDTAGESEAGSKASESLTEETSGEAQLSATRPPISLGEPSPDSGHHPDASSVAAA